MAPTGHIRAQANWPTPPHLPGAASPPGPLPLPRPGRGAPGLAGHTADDRTTPRRPQGPRGGARARRHPQSLPTVAAPRLSAPGPLASLTDPPASTGQKSCVQRLPCPLSAGGGTI
jgi:hypothetical protein